MTDAADLLGNQMTAAERDALASYEALKALAARDDLPPCAARNVRKALAAMWQVTNDLDLDVDDLKQLVEDFKVAVREHSGAEFPQHPREQLDLAIRAVFNSWNTDRARLYRRRERIPQPLHGTIDHLQAGFVATRPVVLHALAWPSIM